MDEESWAKYVLTKTKDEWLDDITQDEATKEMQEWMANGSQRAGISEKWKEIIIEEMSAAYGQGATHAEVLNSLKRGNALALEQIRERVREKAGKAGK